MPFHTQRIVITTNKVVRRMTQNESLIQTYAKNKRKFEWFILTEGLSLKDANTAEDILTQLLHFCPSLSQATQSRPTIVIF